MDSDLTNAPEDIDKFVIYMEKGYDIIKASRYSDGGSVSGVPFYRYLISRIGNAIARALVQTPITDITNGFRAIKLNNLSGISLNEKGFAIITEEFCRLYSENILVANIGVCLKNRNLDIRPTSFVYTPKVFWTYLKYPVFYFLRKISK